VVMLAGERASRRGLQGVGCRAGEVWALAENFYSLAEDPDADRALAAARQRRPAAQQPWLLPAGPRGDVATPGWACLRPAPARPAGRAITWDDPLMIPGAEIRGRSAGWLR
jgi:hypothetical protein